MYPVAARRNALDAADVLATPRIPLVRSKVEKKFFLRKPQPRDFPLFRAYKRSLDITHCQRNSA